MSDERDLQLLDLFSKPHKPLDNETFIAHVLEQVEREQKASARIRFTVLIGVLVLTAFAMPWLVRYVAIASTALTVDLRDASFAVDAGSTWLPTAALSLVGFCVALMWRTLRKAR